MNRPFHHTAVTNPFLATVVWLLGLVALGCSGTPTAPGEQSTIAPTDGAVTSPVAPGPRLDETGPRLVPSECPGSEGGDPPTVQCFRLRTAQTERPGDRNEVDLMIVSYTHSQTPTPDADDSILPDHSTTLVVGGAFDYRALADLDDSGAGDDDQSEPIGVALSLAGRHVVQMMPRGSPLARPRILCTETLPNLSLSDCASRLELAGVDPGAYGPDDIARDIKDLREHLQVTSWPVVIGPDPGVPAIQLATWITRVDAEATEAIIVRDTDLGHSTGLRQAGLLEALSYAATSCQEQPSCSDAFPEFTSGLTASIGSTGLPGLMSWYDDATGEVLTDKPVQASSRLSIETLSATSRRLDMIALWPELITRAFAGDASLANRLSSYIITVDPTFEELVAYCAHSLPEDSADVCDTTTVTALKSYGEGGVPPHDGVAVLIETAYFDPRFSNSSLEEVVGANDSWSWLRSGLFIYQLSPCVLEAERRFLDQGLAPQQHCLSERPEFFVRDEKVTLEFDEEEMALSSPELVIAAELPASWTAQHENWFSFSRLAHGLDEARLTVEVAPDETAEDLLAMTVRYSSYELSDPETQTKEPREGTRIHRNHVAWTLHPMAPTPYTGIAQTVAVASLDKGAVAVTLRSDAAEHDMLRQTVLLRVLDTLRVHS